MPVTRRSQLDCNTTDNMGERILELKEIIAHKLTYQEDSDAELLQIELEALIEQNRRRKDYGKQTTR